MEARLSVNPKIRTIYFKVQKMEPVVQFWKTVLQVEPHKTFSNWHEFMCSHVRLGLLLNDFGDTFSGCNCVPVFEFEDHELLSYIERAKVAGADVILNGLDDPRLKSVVLRDPFGNEFEFSKFHD